VAALALAGCNLGIPPVVIVSFPGEAVLDLFEADVDVDGDQDVVTRFSSGMSVALSDGAGGFTVLPRVPAIVRAVGDVSGDGRPDALVTLGQGSLGYRVGDGAGGFSRTTRLLPDSPDIVEQVTVADLATQGSPSSVLFGAGDGTFEDAHDVLGGGEVTGDVLSEDVDGDGQVDLVYGSYLTGEVRLMRNGLDGARTH